MRVFIINTEFFQIENNINYLQRSLPQYKLSNLAMIAIENNIADSLNMGDIELFALQKTRKNFFFLKLTF